jgi:hypothetical protein
MESQFVLLAEIDAKNPPPGLLLNILEMWCCLIFQTLTKGSLARYLPEDIKVRCPGIHLNVATPLQQRVYDEQDKSISVRKSFADLYRSVDPLVQQYYRSLRESFYNLPNSDDPILRAYFSSIFRKNQLAGAAVKRDNARKKAALGFETIIKINSRDGRGRIHYNHYDFCLSRSLKFWSVGMIVKVYLDVLESPHPHQYAKDALASDPAARLGIRITGKDTKKASFEHWISSKGHVKAMMMNTLVDLLEGIPIEVTEKQPRRWLPKDLSRNRRKITITS